MTSMTEWELLGEAEPAHDSFYETRSSNAGSLSSACSSEDLLNVDYDPPTSIQLLQKMTVIEGRIQVYFIIEGLPLLGKDSRLVTRSSTKARASTRESERDDGESATSYEDDNNSGSTYGFSSSWITGGTLAVVGIFVLGEMLGEQQAILAPQGNNRRRSTCPFEMERQLGFW